MQFITDHLSFQSLCKNDITNQNELLDVITNQNQEGSLN